MIQRIVTYRVEPDAVDDVRAAIDDFIAGIRRHEPGTVAYHAYQYEDDPTAFVHTMTFADAHAREVHVATDHVKQFVARLYPRCVEQPEFRDFRTVSSSTDPGVA